MKRWFGHWTLILFCASSLYSQGTVVRVGLDEWPPFSGTDLPSGGLSAELITRVFEKAGYRTEIELLPWSRVEFGVQNGSLDVMGNLYEIDSIKAYADYSQPYFRSRVRFLAKSSFNAPIWQLRDATPFSIALGVGYSFGKGFDEANYLKKSEVPLTTNGVQMMKLGRTDLVIDSEEVLTHLARSDLTGPSPTLKILPFVVAENSLCIGALKSNPRGARLIAAFDAALVDLRRTGDWDRIVAKYRSP